ncbi:uncharacterized protein LOC132049767 isoform X1 [Lycium ferocissimum]|uniref:uncharacterized protein LOC132049767 isoform X1 n=2 Tax=Lycium ferocissimum TaxID=112874 RepID=UPI0028153E1C|nr:uncharacterized protein LOC132049767 isoform X1 [Lycium ferocissimum]
MVALSNNNHLLSLPLSSTQSATPRVFNHLGFSYIRRRAYLRKWKLWSAPKRYNSSSFRVKRFQLVSAKNYEAGQSEDAEEIMHKASDDLTGNLEDKTVPTRSSLLAKLVIALGIAATVTFLSIGLKQPNQESNFGIQYLVDGSSSSTIATPAPGFSFKAFGYRVMLPEYAPGWVYFWLLMAAGFGLFISEEALNIWVGISIARMLVLDGTWQSLANSFSRNAPYITSTILWVYWGVCLSDMIPFYLGKLFKQSGASNDVYSKLGIGNQKARDITDAVQKYGNLIGLVERFSLGVRNPTAFLAGALDISPECFFAGVCCGGLMTLPIQLTIGFLLRERPVFAVATVATVVGIWTVFPYAVAAVTALFLYLRRQFSG